MVDWNPFSDESWDEQSFWTSSGKSKKSGKKSASPSEDGDEPAAAKPLHGFGSLKTPLPSLPQGSAELAQSQERRPPEPPPEGVKRILVIDDNLMVRRNHRAFLERLGFQAIEAVDGRNGLAKLDYYGPESFSLIIADLNMPVMNGDEFVAKAKEKFAERLPPVWVCTISSDADIVKSVIAKGIAGYLLKPVQPRVFATKLQSLFPDLELRIP